MRGDCLVRRGRVGARVGRGRARARHAAAGNHGSAGAMPYSRRRTTVRAPGGYGTVRTRVLRRDRERCRAGRKDGMRLRCAQQCTRSLWLPLKVSRRSGPVRLLFATLVESCARRSLSHVQHAVIRCRRRLRPRREGSPGSSGAVLGRAWSASGRWAHVVRHDHHDERFCAPT